MYRRRRRSRKAPLARCREEKCHTKRCRNRKAVKYNYYKSPRTGEVIKYVLSLNHCWKCRARMLKERQPATYVLNALRNRAKQRKVPWTISLAEFKKWCAETGYLEKRGRKMGSASIDRINHNRGYHINNIQIRTLLENCTIGHYVPGENCKQNESVDYDPEERTAEPEPDLVVVNGEPF